MYVSKTMEEREKAKNGHARRPSVELFTAFKKAAKDPSNLRLLTHAEHTKHGDHAHKGQFSPYTKQRAEALFNNHLPRLNSSTQEERDDFDNPLLREKAALPVDKQVNTVDQRKSTREGLYSGGFKGME